jgi:TonB family protein
MGTIGKAVQKSALHDSIGHQAKPEDLRTPLDTDFQSTQRRRMLLAAFLLLLAVGVLLVRDWDLWFEPGDTDVADIETTQAASIEAYHAANNPAPELPKGKSKKNASVAAVANPRPGLESPIVTDRKALPPMEVQIVSGNEPRVLRPNSDPVKVDMQEAQERASSPMLEFAEAAAPPSTNASQRVTMSPDTTSALETPVAPSYPVLARQMKVQGAVSIQALISANGDIQDLRILSGPSILASAAQEAVRQWRFKPYLQNGQPVETQARITVNFTISTF